MPGAPPEGDPMLLHSMLPAERDAYLRKLRFPKAAVLTAGCPAGVASVLTRALTGMGELVVLRGHALSGLQLGRRLASVLEHNPRGVRELRLGDAMLGDEETATLLGPIARSDPDPARAPALAALDLSRNGLRLPATFALLEGVLRCAAELRELDLSGNAIGDGGAARLASVLRPRGDIFCGLERLNLRRCGIGPEGGAALCDAFAGSETIREVVLTGNIFADDNVGAPALQRLLAGVAGKSGTGLRALVVGDVGLHSVLAMEALCGGLADSEGANVDGVVADRRDNFNRALRDLCMPGNRFGDGAAPALGDAIRAARHLTLLNVSGCGLGDPAARVIATAIQAHPSLRVLHLGNNRVENAGAGALGRAIEENAVLTELALNDNGITPSGFNAIFTPLRNNKALCILNLAGNQFGPGLKAPLALSLCLRMNVSLKELDLSRCGMRDEGIVVLDLGDVDDLGQVHGKPKAGACNGASSSAASQSTKFAPAEAELPEGGMGGLVVRGGGVPGPVSVCSALTENFVLDVLRVDQNSLSALAQDALDEAMTREKRPLGHVLDVMEHDKEVTGEVWEGGTALIKNHLRKSQVSLAHYALFPLPRSGAMLNRGGVRRRRQRVTLLYRSQ